MSETLVVAVAQPESALHDAAFNADRHAAAIRAAGARIVVFPELSLTGYGMDVQPIDLDDPSMNPIVEACEETEAIALVGAPTPGENGTVRVSTLRIDGHEATVALGIDVYVAGVCETEEDHAVQAERATRVTRDHGVWVALALPAQVQGHRQSH